MAATMQHAKVVIFAVLLLALFIGCGASTPTPSVTIETSAPKPPSWIDKPPQGGNTLYFVGTNTGSETRKDGLEAATTDAYDKASQFLGVRIESKFELEQSDFGHSVQQSVKSTSAAKIQSATIADVYTVRKIRQRGYGSPESYDTYVLLQYSREEAIREARRQAEEKRLKLETAYNFYREARDHESKKSLLEARSFYKKALAMLAALDETIASGKPGIPNSRDLQAALENSLRSIHEQLSRVALAVTMHVPKEAVDAFNANLSAALAESGFSIVSGLPSLLVTGTVEVTEGGQVLDHYIHYAQGSLTASRHHDNTTIAVEPFKEKGVHRTRRQATVDAMSLAGRRAGEALAARILAQDPM